MPKHLFNYSLGIAYERKVIVDNAIEIQEWKERVIYDIAFRKNSEADIDLLGKLLFQSLEKFTIIASSSDACVYKIGRYFVERGVSNKAITFMDGRVITAYIDTKAQAPWQQRSLIDNLMKLEEDHIKGSWVFIPKIQCAFDILSAIYLTTRMQNLGALGLVFYAEGPGNLAEILCQSTDIKVTQFPEVKYKKPRAALIADKW